MAPITSLSARKAERPTIRDDGLTDASATGDGWRTVVAQERRWGIRRLYAEGSPRLLVTENETNYERIFQARSASPYVKDGIDEYIVHGRQDAVNPRQTGTKVAARYNLELAAGEKKPAAASPAPVRPTGSVADDPLVKEAMNRFDATNVRVTPRGRG